MSTPPQEPSDQHGAPGPQQPQQQPPAGGPWQPGPPRGTGAGGDSTTGGGADSLDAKGFFAALFDWRFHTLITPKIVSIVYLVGMVLIGLTWLLVLLRGFTMHPLAGLFVLIIGPIMAVVYLAFWRMTLELYFAIVRMSDDIHRSSNAPRH